MKHLVGKRRGTIGSSKEIKENKRSSREGSREEEKEVNKDLRMGSYKDIFG